MTDANVPLGTVLEDSTTLNRLALFCVKKEKVRTPFGEDEACTQYEILKYHRTADKEFGYTDVSAPLDLKTTQALSANFKQGTPDSFYALEWSEWYCSLYNDEVLCWFPGTGMIGGVGTLFFVSDLIATPFRAIIHLSKRMKNRKEFKRLQNDFFHMVYGKPNLVRTLSHSRFEKIENALKTP